LKHCGDDFLNNQFHFRPYETSDAGALDQLLHVLWNEDIGAIRYYAPNSALNNADRFHHTIVVEQLHASEMSIVAFGNVSHYAEQPTHAFLNFNVHPNFQYQGIGTILFQQLVALLATKGAYPLLTATYENQAHAVAFLKKLGFQEQMRTYLPHLDVAQVKLDELEQKAAALSERGYHILSMAAAATDPARDQKLADLLYEIYAAIHPLNPPSLVMYEQRREIFLSDLLPEATFIAVHQEDYAAVGTLHESERPNALDFGLSGVSSIHQTHALDLALAVKMHEITFARQRQVQRLVAEVDSTDTLGTQVLAHLPFHHRPAWVTFERTL
jgi:mycothiol synthase